MPAPIRPNSFLDRVLNGKQARSVPFPDQTSFGTYGRPAPFKPKQSLEAYGDNAWLYSSVNVIASELARTNFLLQKRNAKGEMKPIERHQALDTMQRPQPIGGGKTMLTKMLLKMVTAFHLLLNGEAFWLLDRRLPDGLGRAPQRIDLLIPEFVYTRANSDGELVEYIYRLFQHKEIRIDPMDVVHFRLPDPAIWERGHAPTQSIRYALDNNKESDIRNLRLLMNNAVPSGIITTGGQVNKTQIDLIKSQWRQGYGGAENAGKVAVVPEGMDFKSIQQTNQEMQFLEGKKMNMEEILANFRVGPEMLGKTDSQTRANADAAIFVFQRFGMLPFVELFADTLTNDYLPAFPGTDGMEFGFPDPVPENMEDKRANADSLFNGGALTPNERRKMFGLETLNLPGMDNPYLPISAVPVGEPPLQGSNAPAPAL